MRSMSAAALVALESLERLDGPASSAIGLQAGLVGVTADESGEQTRSIGEWTERGEADQDNGEPQTGASRV
eukprot:5645258-Pyramimonas_sp.AAC.4